MNWRDIRYNKDKETAEINRIITVADLAEWRGTINERLVNLDKTGERIASSMGSIQADVRDILKWRYHVVGASAVITIIVSAFISFTISFIVKRW